VGSTARACNDMRQLTLFHKLLGPLSIERGWLVRVCVVFCVALCVMVAGLDLALARGPQNWIPAKKAEEKITMEDIYLDRRRPSYSSQYHQHEQANHTEMGQAIPQSYDPSGHARLGSQTPNLIKADEEAWLCLRFESSTRQ